MKKQIKPISPSEITDNLDEIIPNVVIKSVNKLLREKYRGTGSIVLKQDEIVKEIQKLDKKLTKNDIFNQKMLDFEKLYRDNGWIVKYDKPGWDESYEPYFEFNKSK